MTYNTIQRNSLNINSTVPVNVSSTTKIMTKKTFLLCGVYPIDVCIMRFLCQRVVKYLITIIIKYRLRHRYSD